MKALVSLFCFILICVVGTAPAQQKQKTVKSKPDLTGTWLLDPSRSNVGSSRTPDRPLKITHHDPELKITGSHLLLGRSRRDKSDDDVSQHEHGYESART